MEAFRFIFEKKNRRRHTHFLTLNDTNLLWIPNISIFNYINENTN